LILSYYYSTFKATAAN